jgi:hypothetical protein
VYVLILRPAEVAVIILTFSEYICQPFAYYMGHMPAEYQETVRKMIAILGLGQQPSLYLITQKNKQTKLTNHLND